MRRGEPGRERRRKHKEGEKQLGWECVKAEKEQGRVKVERAGWVEGAGNECLGRGGLAEGEGSWSCEEWSWLWEGEQDLAQEAEGDMQACGAADHMEGLNDRKPWPRTQIFEKGEGGSGG